MSELFKKGIGSRTFGGETKREVILLLCDLCVHSISIDNILEIPFDTNQFA